jgi:ribosomal 50S subunit-recycling heat shock protein
MVAGYVRLDKFLKVSRIIKRRTLANEVCDQGHVSVNGRVAKAGMEVKPGDVLEIRFGQRMLKLEVVDVRDNVPAKLAAELYKVLEETT